MRVCLSFLVVELMRQGCTPQCACVQGIQRLLELHGNEAVFGEGFEGHTQHKKLTVGVIALSVNGMVSCMIMIFIIIIINYVL